MILLVFVCCSHARPIDQDSTKSVFKYREIYLPEAIGSNADTLGLNTLDSDWAIWGHNLGRVLPEKPSESIYAKVNGVVNKSQFCFSSNRLFEYICDFIDNEYGPNDHSRFAIIPNDNDIVCLCVRCVEAGNTKDDVSPAVFNMVKRLAERYPNHIFYTSDYRTTKNLPKEQMPPNTGVMVSAMDYPLSYAATPEEESFLNVLSQWGEKTHRILIWDYINNFDDYFTPYPIFGVMQNRLKNYRDNNVTAVFLNGSGTDASSFSHIKSLVLAEITANPDQDWKEILKQKATELYPVSGETVSDFIIAQENFIQENGKSLPLYEGVKVALDTYLPESQFVEFYKKLSELKDKAKGKEREELETLLAELSLTRLELNRIHGNVKDSKMYLDQLESLGKKNISIYSESGWPVERYIRDYRNILSHHHASRGKNKLAGVSLEALTPLDEEYRDLSLLTDGLLGMPSNYHNGNLITSPEKETKIAIPKKGIGKKIVAWFSVNPSFRIALPEEVTLTGEGIDPISLTPELIPEMPGHARVEFDIPSGLTGSYVLTVKKEPDTKSMAIEEIEIY